MLTGVVGGLNILIMGDIYSTAHFRGENLAWFSLASRLSLENFDLVIRLP